MSERTGKVFIRDIAHSVVIPGDKVVRSAEVARVGGHSPTVDTAAAIEVITEANVVRAIDITCSCGEKMRLWCSYESHGETPKTAEAR